MRNAKPNFKRYRLNAHWYNELARIELYLLEMSSKPAPVPKPAVYKKGDVVLVSFPYTTDEGQTQTKRRPAVIISNDNNNARLDDVLLVPLTSNVTRAAGSRLRWLCPWIHKKERPGDCAWIV